MIEVMAQHDRHPVALADALRRQPRCQLPDRLRQTGAGQVTAVMAQIDMIRARGGGTGATSCALSAFDDGDAPKPPNRIATGMIAGTFDAEAIKALVPMKRAGRPEEVADLVAFLASDQAAYISGQIISINGALI